MKPITLTIRTQLFLALNQQVLYNTKFIPVYEEYLPDDGVIATLPAPNLCDAYIVLKNQTANEDILHKCGHNDQSSIQIQVYTNFSNGRGGSKTAEEITAKIFDLLFVDGKFKLNMPSELHLWKGAIESTRNIQYLDDTTRTWTTITTLLLHVSQ